MKAIILNKKQAGLLLFLLLAAGALLRVGFACSKSTWHVDEGISVALTNGSWEPGFAMPVKDRWMSADELRAIVFVDALAAAGKADYGMIAGATAKDVHPPLYYWLFAFMRVLSGAGNFLLAGYLLNILLYLVTALILAAILWRIFADPLTVLAGTALFVFSSGALSVTLFLRMYELLQTVSVGFFASALLVVSSARDGPDGRPCRHCLGLGLGGLALFAYLGMLTQYYFIFVLIPVGAFSLVYLLLKKKFSTLIWGALSVEIALYLAYRTFPAMLQHLFFSYRAGQSLGNLVGSSAIAKLGNLWQYGGLISRNLIPVAIVLTVVLAGVVLRHGRRDTAKEIAEAKETAAAMASKLSGVRVLFLMAALVSVFSWAIISLSAPYQTLRYIVSFFPFFILAFVSLVHLLFPEQPAKKLAGTILCATALWVVVHGLIPANIGQFHEDYPIDADAYYVTDSTPLVIMSTIEAGSWKNMLMYINLRGDKPVYVADSLMPAEAVARFKSGDSYYAVVDTLFNADLPFEKIGYYGFYTVYRITVK